MSILQKNLLNKNTLSTKSVGISSNIFGSSQPTIKFNKNIKSIDIKKYLFINKISSTKSVLAKKIKNDQRRFANHDIDVDNEFEIKYILDQKGEQKKLDYILNNTIGKTVPVLSCVRLKTIGNEGLQYYISDDYKGGTEVVLIDLYHLFIPAADKARGERHPNPKRTYEDHINDSHDLSEIINTH